MIVMNVLAYLLSPPQSALPGVGSHNKITRILFGGRKTNEGDEQLERFSGILIELEKGE
jgi:hypothetical protein